MKFSGSDVTVTNNNTGSNGGAMVTYLKPNIHELQFTKMSLEINQNGNKYINCELYNNDGQLLTRQYYLTTNKGVSGKSAFDISMESLKKLSIAIEKETEYDAISVDGDNWEESMVKQLSAIYMGQWFRAKVKGEEVVGKKGSFVKSLLSDAYESIKVPRADSRLKFSEDRDIKRLPAGTTTSSTTSAVPAPTGSDDLPF